MRALLATWRRQSRRHPSVLVLTLAGALAFLAGAILMAGPMPLLGELVAGLGVAPLAMALYISLLADVSWPERGGGDDDGGGGQRTPDLPQQPGGGGGDWARFERDFWAYVDQRVPVG